MSVDELRGRLMRLSQLMDEDQNIQIGTEDEMRDALKLTFETYAERPLLAVQGANSILVEARTVVGINPFLELLGSAIEKSCASVLMLSQEGFYEGAWFRASDALEEMGLYLDGIDAIVTYQEQQKVAQS